MSKPLLTILTPGIRINNWQRLLDSIKLSYSGPIECIFIGPQSIDLDTSGNFPCHIRFIKTFRSPIASQQIGLLAAEGEYIDWAADDGEFLPGAHDKTLQLLENEPYTTIVMGKYLEGDGHGIDSTMRSDEYYRLNASTATSAKYIPPHYMGLNMGLVTKQLLIELGGWDSENFEACPMAHADLSVRAQNYGAKHLINQELMFRCTHEPNTTGTHGPIHWAQLLNDEPRFKEIYNEPESIYRTKIDLNNWKHTSEIWARRFG